MVDEVRVLPATSTQRERMAQVFASRLQQEVNEAFDVKYHSSHDGHTVFVGQMMLEHDGSVSEVKTYIYMPDPLVDSGYWDEVFSMHIADRIEETREALSEMDA